MKKLKSLDDLLVHSLKDLYYVEKQIIKALPKMIKNASSEELRQAFENHLGETEEQVTRLEKVFDELGIPAKAKKCPAIDGIIEEAKELMGEDSYPSVMDAGLIVAAQKVEHYEIATYGCVRTFANVLGYNKIADILQTTLEEESAADKKLTEIAESSINVEAAEGQEQEEESVTF